MVKFSLIIAVYNRVHLLRKSLIALKNQSIFPDELILSDDGSDEDIKGGILEIVKDLSFPVKIVRQEHKGFRLARCRNNSVKASSGDFLIFFDQDVIHTENYIQTFIQNRKEKRFLTAYPIRLTEKQSENITEDCISKYDFNRFLLPEQKIKIKKQFFKDYISFVGRKLLLVKNKPKIRGGFCAINRQDYLNVNGYDEKFIGWGNEDDDIRRRLYKSGVYGFNPFYNEYPIHLYHEPFHKDGKRVNKDYNLQQIKKINEGEFYCKYGYDNPLDDAEVEVINLN